MEDARDLTMEDRGEAEKEEVGRQEGQQCATPLRKILLHAQTLTKTAGNDGGN